LSLFQRILQKDEAASVEFVGVIADIRRMSSNETLVVVISDGRYCLSSHKIKRNGGENDERMMMLIEKGKMYIGMKIRCVNQSVVVGG
jgi:hypothetical protein